MGLFDYIKCRHPLPDGYAPERDPGFQTKSLDCDLSTYEITDDGRLLLTATGCKDSAQDTPLHLQAFHGSITFYTGAPHTEDAHYGPSGKFFCTKNDQPPRWYEYCAMFTHGKLSEINGGSRRMNEDCTLLTRAEFAKRKPEFEKEREQAMSQSINDQHNKAMELTYEAMELKRLGKLDEAQAIFARAAEEEWSAARRTHVQPSMGVLYRSAAWLFLDAGQVGQALDVVSESLVFGRVAGPMPDEIKAELAEVLEHVAKQLKGET